MSDRNAPLFSNLRATPDRAAALARYERLARDYDASCHWLNGVRLELLALLELEPGAVVIDAGCGTGALLPPLSRMVGREGRVIGIEQSPAMAALARERVSGERCPNVTIVEAAAEQVRLDQAADAVVFCYTHDLLQSEAAVANLLGSARPGAMVVAAGACLAPWWAGPVNLWKLWRSRRYLTTFAGLRDPAAGLARRCPDWRVVSTRLLGTSYLGRGHVAEGQVV